MSSPQDTNASLTTDFESQSRRLSVATWNMDHWKQTVQTRRDAWSYLTAGLGCDIALLQECVAPKDLDRSRLLYREIGGSRPWGSAVAVLNEEMSIEEVGAVRTTHGSTRFPMLGTYPGATIVARVEVPGLGPITCVSVYGLINVYAQTTMLRIIADLIPLFDSPDGERVVLGGDMNITTAMPPSAPELRRYEAILKAVESLGLRNLVETAAERPPQLENCLCGASSCHHLHTYGANPGSQLDWLFATPELAARCRRLRVDRGGAASLSDHAPIVAEFEIPLGVPDRQWEPESFVQEVATRNGPEAGMVAEEIVAWAQRKHHELRRRDAFASLDRLYISPGPYPELWVQLDLRYPENLGYTISLTAAGMVKLQFQYMRSEEARRQLWEAIRLLPRVDLQARLNGRPSFPMRALTAGDNLQRFLAILEGAVDEMVRSHKRGAA